MSDDAPDDSRKRVVGRFLFTSMPHQSTSSLLEQMDTLLEEEDLSTKNGLRFAFTVLREAMGALEEIERSVKESKSAYAAIAQNSSDVATRFDDVSKKVSVMWVGYQMLTWVATVFGVSIIALIWSLITGAATITFGGSP